VGVEGLLCWSGAMRGRGRRGGKFEGQRIVEVALELLELSEKPAGEVGVGGVVDEVVYLPGVGLEVEKLGAVDLGVEDELVAIGADHPLEVAVGAVDGPVEGGFFAGEQRGEGGGFDVVGDGQVGEMAGGGEDAVVVDQGVDLFVGGDVGAGDDEGDADGVIVLVLFA